MEVKVYKTDKLTFISYLTLVVAYALFISLLIVKAGGFSASSLILSLFVLPVVAYFIFLLKKEVRLSEEGLEVFGLTGRKKIRWEEVASVSITPGRKYFLFIEGKGGKLAVIDDSTENFKEIAQEIKKKVPDKVQENFDELISSYKRSYLSTAVLLVAALGLIFIAVKSFLL
ncbi:PH domain-containing protein [Thermovibrio sp.]